jgi:beta-glucosidase
VIPLDYSFGILLKQLVRERNVSEQRVDESVRRILQLKVKFGLLQNPSVEPEAGA